MHALNGRTADDVWSAAARLFDSDALARKQAGRGGDTMEALHVGMSIELPRERWVVSRTPAINPAFAFVEVFWILAGRRDSGLLLHWNPRLSRFCGGRAEYHGAYGGRLRSHFGIDQLDRVYHALRANPDTRQAVLEIWDARVDLPDEHGIPASEDIPCNVVAMPKVRDGRLDWLQVIRSNDLFLGVPHNIVQFTSLQEVLAGWLGISLGSYHQVSDSLHVYMHDIDAVQASVTRVPLPANVDSLAIDRASWDQVMEVVMTRLDAMTRSRTKSNLRSLVAISDAPSAYENALRIAAADSARRRGWHDLAAEFVANVANPALHTLWERWRERTLRTSPTK